MLDKIDFSVNAIFWAIAGGVIGTAFGIIGTIIYNKINSRTKVSAWTWTKCLDWGFLKDPDIFLTVRNDGNETVPVFKVHVMDFDKLNVRFKLEDIGLSELRSGQSATYKLKD